MGTYSGKVNASKGLRKQDDGNLNGNQVGTQTGTFLYDERNSIIHTYTSPFFLWPCLGLKRFSGSHLPTFASWLGFAGRAVLPSHCPVLPPGRGTWPRGGCPSGPKSGPSHAWCGACCWRWAHADRCGNERRGCLAGHPCRAGGDGLALGVGCAHVCTWWPLPVSNRGSMCMAPTGQRTMSNPTPLIDDDGEVCDLSHVDTSLFRPAAEVLPPELYAGLLDMNRRAGVRGSQPAQHVCAPDGGGTLPAPPSTGTRFTSLSGPV